MKALARRWNRDPGFGSYSFEKRRETTKFRRGPGLNGFDTAARSMMSSGEVVSFTSLEFL